jgi:hypothetical protein
MPLMPVLLQSESFIDLRVNAGDLPYLDDAIRSARTDERPSTSHSAFEYIRAREHD